MSEVKKSKVVKNTIMLYILNITKLVLPLITLPYLTRILAVESYGVVTYVKSIMSYLQLFIDCGFILSATKDIVRMNGNKKKIGEIVGNVILGKVILSFFSFVILMALVNFIPILRENPLFVLLSFIPVFLTTFLLDFLFRGLEKMEIITFRFLIMKGISTILTFVLVKSDADLLMIPTLDIISSIVAIVWINFTLKKIGIRLRHGTLKKILKNLKNSLSYFVSNIASTAFGVLNTVVVGIFLTKSDVAYWSLVLQLVSAVQAFYTPITDGIYPQMVRDQNLGLIKKILKIYTPIIISGCVFTYIAAPYVLLIIGGEKYVGQASLLRYMIPVLFFSFYSLLFGWPILGSIDKVKENTFTTVVACLIQVLGLVILIISHNFSLITLAILRGVTECSLTLFRGFFGCKYRKKFTNS